MDNSSPRDARAIESVSAIFLMNRFAYLVALTILAGLHQSGAAQETESQQAATLGYMNSLRAARNQLMSVSDYEAALEPAQILAQEAQEAGESDAFADRVMFAIVLAELDRLEEAELELLDVVESVEASDGRNAASVITPLRMLGRTYMRMQMFPEAVAALTEARSVSRRSAGLFNVEHQIEVIDDLTTAQLGLGDTQAARDLQLERLEVAQRQFGTDDVQVIPYHYHLADYYESSRMRRAAREQYREALTIAQERGDTEQILISMSNIVRQDLQTAASDTNTENLAELVLSLPTDFYSDGLALANAVLGDAALIDEDDSLAATYYARSWDLFEATGEVDPAVYFADPAVIRFIAPLSAADFATLSLPVGWGTIALEFDVDAQGRVSEITGTTSEPSGVMDDAYVERIEDAWFRPALVAGEPVAATGVVFTHYFRFYYDPEQGDD
jgi:tetratricopeptide (TPR) repeat protein